MLTWMMPKPEPVPSGVRPPGVGGLACLGGLDSSWDPRTQPSVLDEERLPTFGRKFMNTSKELADLVYSAAFLVTRHIRERLVISWDDSFLPSRWAMSFQQTVGLHTVISTVQRKTWFQLQQLMQRPCGQGGPGILKTEIRLWG